jgi:glutamate-1-semialdehyde 2,1-aminomutase
MPSAERVRFTSSGTEATLLAMRLARAFTGRSKVMRFKGHFHGWHDHVAFGVASHFDGGVTPGVLPELSQHTVLASVDDPAETKRLIETESHLAAVMIEPTGASWGQAPVKPELLHQLREWTAKRGVLLIFDEVISGFRVSPGGAQGAFDIKPDLTTLAKILAGGLPGGALVGRADILAPLAFPEAGATSAAEKVPHHGTFNANPLSAAAGSAALKIVAESDACSRANAYAAKLREAMQRTLRDAQVPWCVYGTFSGFHIFTNPQRLSVTPAEIEAGKLDYRAIKTGRDPVLLNKLRLGMLIHGVEIFSWPGGPTSAVHGGDDLEQTVAAFRDTLKMLRDEGHV